MQQPNKTTITTPICQDNNVLTNKKMISNAANNAPDDAQTIEARIKRARRQRISNCPFSRTRSVSVPQR